MINKVKCETGRYYWDASLNKAVEIDETTDQDIIDSHYYRINKMENLKPDWEERSYL